jgi:hypothetical protein
MLACHSRESDTEIAIAIVQKLAYPVTGFGELLKVRSPLGRLKKVFQQSVPILLKGLLEIIPIQAIKLMNIKLFFFFFESILRCGQTSFYSLLLLQQIRR